MRPRGRARAGQTRSGVAAPALSDRLTAERCGEPDRRARDADQYAGTGQRESGHTPAAVMLGPSGWSHDHLSITQPCCCRWLRGPGRGVLHLHWLCDVRLFFARWSSLVARLAHNQEVGGSNPSCATNVLCPSAPGVFAYRREQRCDPPREGPVSSHRCSRLSVNKHRGGIMIATVYLGQRRPTPREVIAPALLRSKGTTAQDFVRRVAGDPSPGPAGALTQGRFLPVTWAPSSGGAHFLGGERGAL